MDAKQQKTFVGIILIVILGAVACCGLTVAIGAFVGYQEAQQLAAAGPPDAGSATAPSPDPDDPDAPPDDSPLRQQFADEILAGLADAGREDYVYQPATFDLVADGGAQISLDNLYDEYAARDESERPDFVDRTIRGFFPQDVPTEWARAAPDVVVTVRDRIFVELLAVRSDKPLDVLRRPLSDDLVELVVYDGPDSMQYLTDDHLSDWGKTADEVFRQGRKQLAARSKEPFTSLSPGVWESPWADNHDIGRAVLFDTIRKLEVKGDPVLFLPQRDHLLVTGSNDAEGLLAMGELLSERLDLPRSNTGRGWRLTRQGLVPFIPGADDALLTALRLEASAKDANEQKKALDEKYAQDGTDIFVGTTLFTEDDDGVQRTYCVWTRDADTLMPKADFIVFVDLDLPEPDRVVAAAPWDSVMKKLGSQVAPDDSFWPRRYKVTTFPDKRMLKSLGTHPFFRRNKE
ncbi:MAG: hypothetical protein Q8L48_01380 [Archangium sp.]|nr:hypothetical protein [Archangium sp.]